MVSEFRAWSESLGKMYTVTRIDFQLRLVAVLENSRVFSFDNIILMKSTGLKDSEGVEIFHRDIVEMKWNIYQEPELFRILMRAGHAPRLDDGQKDKELWLCNEVCKVVGNELADPELINTI